MGHADGRLGGLEVGGVQGTEDRVGAAAEGVDAARTALDRGQAELLGELGSLLSLDEVLLDRLSHPSEM